MDREVTQWFIDEYPKHVASKLDMGKSCIRFKKMDQIPFELVGQLLNRQTVEDFVDAYQTAIKRIK